MTKEDLEDMKSRVKGNENKTDYISNYSSQAYAEVEHCL